MLYVIRSASAAVAQFCISTWNSVPDALASAANYLKHAGWKPGQVWGRRVKLPNDLSVAGRNCELKPVSEWSRRGVRRWARRSSWFLKVDVEKFYDSVSHAGLMALLERRFSERRLLRLLDVLLESYETGPGRGLPIGAWVFRRGVTTQPRSG